MGQPNEIQGIVFVLGVSLFFALSNTLASIAYAGGTDPLSISIFRFILPALILAFILLLTGKQLTLPLRERLIAVALGIITAAYNLALLSAIQSLPVTLAILIFYLFPIFTSIILGLTRDEPVSAATILAGLFAFVGLSFALYGGETKLSSVGIMLSVMAALGLAVVSVVSGQLIRRKDSRQVTLHIMATAFIVTAIATFFRGTLQLPENPAGWIGFVGTNIFYAVAIIGFFAAISMIGPAQATLFQYTEPLITMGLAFLLLSQLVTVQQIIGGAIVVGALIGENLFSRRRSAATSSGD